MNKIEVWKRNQHDNSIEECDFQEVLDFLNNNSEIECDTETTGLDPHIDDILCIQFGDSKNQYLVKWDKDIVDVLKPIFLDRSKLFIFQNAKFDLKFLYKYQIIVNRIYDTYLAEEILKCGVFNAPKNLKYLIHKYLGIVISKEIRENIPELGLTKEVIDYGLDDVKYLSLIKKKQMIEITNLNLKTALDLDCFFVKVLAYIEYCGIGFDKNKWKDKCIEDQKEYFQLQRQMDEMIVDLGIKKFYQYADLFESNPIIKDGISYSTTINWASSKQVGEVFKYLGMDIEIEEDGEIKESVGSRILSQNKGFHPLVDIYSKWIKSAKLISSFGENYFNFINPATNRIHTVYKQILNTGRMSSGNSKENKPNLQQVPSDKRHRECFTPEEGMDLIAADYSGMETVIFANQCLDPGLLKFFDDNLGDMHSYIASLCFKEELNGMPLEDIPIKRKDLRQKAKAAGFSIQFGGVGITISNNLGISEEEGNAVYNAYMEAFPGVKSYFNNSIKKTMENGYIEFNHVTKRKHFFDFIDEFKELQEKVKNIDWTLYRNLKEIGHPDFYDMKKTVSRYFYLKGKMERRSLNYPTQGSGADITKYAAILFFNYLIENNLIFKVKIVNIVHDEILVECPKELSKELSQVLIDSMKKAGLKFFTRVKLDAKCDIGSYWIH